MKTIHFRTERGFTLIEMSIVLIIIGLIIGGILKGQELIESARQKNFVSQIDGIRAGTNSFVDRFRAFPGDYGTAPCTPCVAGNDNGQLNAPAANVAAIAALTGNAAEQYEYWNHLVGAGFIGGGGAALVATGGTAFSGGAVISPLPQSAFPQSGLSIAYGTHEGGATNADSKLTHWIRASRFGTNIVMVAGSTIISPARAQQLDVKFDDGRPDSGRIRTTTIQNTAAGDCGAAGTGGAYDTTETQVSCHLLMSLE